MKFILVGFIALLATLTSVEGYHNRPKFVLNLDLPPEERWAGAIDTVLAHHPYNDSIGVVLEHYLGHLGGLPESGFETLENITAVWHPEMYKEAQGIIAKLLSVGASPVLAKRYWGLLYGYELSHSKGIRGFSELYEKACTGVLSLPQENTSAPILHGRNMDKKPAAARNCTLHIIAQRNGTTVWEAFDWVWLATGLATSAKRGKVTMEFNWRLGGKYLEPLEIVGLLALGATPLMRTMRHVFDNEYDFDQTVHWFNTTQFASPYYLITSGTKRRGAVLALAWDPKDNVVDIIDDSSEQTFMIETNYDRWKPDPADDPRRTVAHDALMMQDPWRRGTKLGLWMALSTYPVHNPDTLFTTLMHVGDDSSGHLIEGYTRTPMMPFSSSSNPAGTQQQP